MALLVRHLLTGVGIRVRVNALVFLLFFPFPSDNCIRVRFSDIVVVGGYVMLGLVVFVFGFCYVNIWPVVFLISSWGK